MSKSNENSSTYEETTAVAVAVQMASAPTQATAMATTTTLQVVPLPIGLTLSELGIEIGRSSSPPTITNVFVEKDSPLVGLVHIGQYCHGIRLPQVEIVNLTDAAQLMDLIQANQHNPRELLLSDTAFYIDPCLQQQQQGGGGYSGALYKHTLPTTTRNTDLGIQFGGFPPVIESVSPHSPCAGRLHSHQTVECLMVSPNQEIFSLTSGAFTSAKLVEKLNNSAHVEGRLLVVKDGVVRSQKGEATWFDWGGSFTNQSSWGIRRMFGK